MNNRFHIELKYRSHLHASRRFVRPRREFLVRTRAEFLEALLQKGVATPVSFSSSNQTRLVVRYAALATAFMLLLNGGAIVLADSQNVAPSHPLYPYKRLGENVQLSLASNTNRPALRSKFAERRLEEMKEVKQEGPHAEELETLNKEFTNEVNAALVSADTVTGISTSTHMSLCNSLGQLIKQHGTLMHKESATKWSAFSDHCREFSGSDTFPVEEE